MHSQPIIGACRRGQQRPGSLDSALGADYAAGAAWKDSAASVPPELLDLLSLFPPWALASPLLGVMAGGLSFVLLGPRLLSLPLYLVLGSLGGLLGQIASVLLELEPWPVALGQVHPAAVLAGATAFLLLARLYRL